MPNPRPHPNPNPDPNPNPSPNPNPNPNPKQDALAESNSAAEEVLGSISTTRHTSPISPPYLHHISPYLA